MSSDDRIRNIVEAALLAAGGPLSVDRLLSLFLDDEQPERSVIREVLTALAEDYAGRGIEIKEVGSGWRIQVNSEVAPWVSRLWEERPPRYSRALMETLALIAYRQPITRGEIEDVRGVTVSTNIVKTLLEREWVRVVGHRDVPGKPALYATTREFLDYFGLKSLEDLPTLAEIKDLDSLNQELPFAEDVAGEGEAGGSANALSESERDEALEPEVADSGTDAADGKASYQQAPETQGASGEDGGAADVESGNDQPAGEGTDEVDAQSSSDELMPESPDKSGMADMSAPAEGEQAREEEDLSEMVRVPHVTH